MKCRGVRGAICVPQNSEQAILEGARTLLEAVIEQNGMLIDDLASIFYTVTPDLDAAFPATGTRGLGLEHTAQLCATEIAAPTVVERCIRVLVHWNTEKSAQEIRHVYLGAAARLRPDRAA
jgi:chorismate mutase